MREENKQELFAFGQGVKALDDEGRFGGYLVVFSDADSPDLTGDYFTKDTDFGEHKTTVVYYDHGFDETLGKTKVGEAVLELDEVGIWMAGQIQRRNDYEKAIWELIQAGKLGASSGTAGHLVERRLSEDGKAWEITSWPLGLDASLTPTPAEPRTSAVPAKSYQHVPLAEAIKSLRAEQENAVQEAPDREAEISDERSLTVKVDAAELAETVDELKQIVEGLRHEATGEQKPVKTNTETEMEDKDQVQEAKQEETPAQVITGLSAAEIKSILNETLDTRFASFREDMRTVKGASNVSAPNLNTKTGLGDDEVKATAYFIRTGDQVALGRAIKASNDTDMNITTDADGGYLVPTGHYQGIIARRDEMMLADRLGVRNIPGKGTTVNVPVDNEADGEFVATSEGSADDRDAPAIDQKAMTLVRYTKRIELSPELLEDEDSRLLAFIENYIGRGMAKTHNSLLFTEVLANGTASLTLDSATAIGAAEIPELAYKQFEEYAEGSAWVMRRATEGYIRGLSGNDFQFRTWPNETTRSLEGFPVYNSQYVGAITASAKSLVFGNFFFVGRRDGAGFSFLRDPYSQANKGYIVLHYAFRTDYAVLQAEAVHYAAHPAS